MKQVRPKKNLGQHFLTDLSIAKRIADTVDACPELPVLEVGPGMGVMTQYLVEKPRPFKVVEIDRESVAYLNEHFPKLRENILGEDFLRMDLRQVFGGQQFVLTGNYPYDISSQIFFKMLDNRDLIPCCTGMIQHEVAVRMAAQPGNKQYGILSVLIQAWYHVEYLFTVEPTVFNPPPKVMSAVIRMTRNEVQQLGCDEQLFKRVVKTVFNQRRKMLRVSLRQLLPADARLFTQNAELLTRRPKQLSIPEFIELTNLVEGEMRDEEEEDRSAPDSDDVPCGSHCGMREEGQGSQGGDGGYRACYRDISADCRGRAGSTARARA
jgi:16S rRNA (adenine1518-N6/adenine1519-N6)-dimethyltransferase